MDFPVQWVAWLDLSQQFQDLPYLAPRHWALLAPEFKPREFRERKTGDPASDNMNPLLLARICSWRRYLGHPCIVSTSYTPPSVGGHSTGSQHYRGRAVDVIVPGISLLDAYLAAERFGFPGIGIYTWWELRGRRIGGLHLDERQEPPARWASLTEKKYVALDARWVWENIYRLAELRS